MQTNVIFNKKKHNALIYFFAKILFKMTGWKLDVEMPKEPKFVLIAVPHTSNWDLPLMLLISIVYGVQFHWVAKDSLFKGPFGIYLKWLGGVPVNRRSRTHFTDQIIEVIKESKELIIVMAPAGTRSRAEYWKSGFYHIAMGAGVPVVFGFLDYGKKIGGFKPGFFPSGDIDKDLEIAAKFYKDKKGKYNENFGSIRVKH